jgi:flagellin-like hook-associated protein FlgL
MGLRIGGSGIGQSLLNQYATINRGTNRATERLATGLRINRASDDPAGMIAAAEMRGDLVDIDARTSTLSARQRQSRIGQSGRQAAADVLREVRGLQIQASDTMISTQERAAIQMQIDASLDAVDGLGQNAGFALPAELNSLRSGGSASVIDGNIAQGIEQLDAQLAAMNRASAAAGAYEKYTLDVDQRLAEDTAVATTQALSLIEDADYAEETSNLVKGRILMAASIKTLALFQRSKSDQVTSLFDRR